MTVTIRISRRTVDALEPKTKPYIAWDNGLQGFGVKVHPSGRRCFVLRYRVGGGRAGKSREPVIGVDGTVTPEAARHVARNWLAKIALGEDPAADRRRGDAVQTMSDLFDRYLTDHAQRHKKPLSVRGDRSLIEKHLRPAFGSIPIGEVTRARIAKWHGGLATTPYQANRGLALLSKVFHLAEVWGLWTEPTNPCRGVNKFREAKRERFLSAEEFDSLFATLDRAAAGALLTEKGNRVWPYAITAIQLLIHTGARSSEILTLKWDWIDLDRGRVDLPDTKTGRRTLILSQEAVAILRAVARIPNNPFVIAGAKPGTHLVNLKDSWDILRRDAGLDGLRVHDLRHSYASVAAAGGMSLPQIGALLGHNSPQTTARYAHLADDVLHRSAAVVSGSISKRRRRT